MANIEVKSFSQAQFYSLMMVDQLSILAAINSHQIWYLQSNFGLIPLKNLSVQIQSKSLKGYDFIIFARQNLP